MTRRAFARDKFWGRCWMALPLLVIGLLLADSSGARAGISGDFYQLPNAPAKGVKLKSGLTLAVDSGWIDGPGYRPIRFRVAPQAGTSIAADRTLVVVVKPNDWGGQSWSGLSVSQQIEIPAGSTGVDVTMPAPQFVFWNQLSLTTFENGEKIEELSVNSLPFTQRGISFQNSSGEPSMLLVRDMGPLSQVFGTSISTSLVQSSTAPNGAPINPNLNQTSTSWRDIIDESVAFWSRHFSGSMAGAVPTSYLPERWIEYSNIDTICLTLDDLKALIEKYPRAWNAIRQWNSAGGGLWITGISSKPSKNDFEHLDRLGKLLDVQDAEKSADNQGWLDPSEQVRRQAWAQPGDPKAVLPPAGFKWRRWGSGTIVAIGPVNPQLVDGYYGGKEDDRPNITEKWAETIFLATGPERATFTGRHGLSLWKQNGDFWNMLIPGVGMPPVTGFQIMITLFVLVIGPLNFSLLRRWGKLNLTVLTVPICSAIVVTSLVVYALAHDGLGTRLRSRSFTRLDQTRGEAVCYARLSLYAGLSPSQGLTFPDDTAVFPLEESPSFSDYNSPRHVLRWTGSEQQLSEGWISARTPTQFYTERVRKSTLALQVVEKEHAAPTVENKLGTAVPLLVLRGSSGSDLFFAEKIPLGGKVELKPIAAADAAARLKTIDSVLTTPPQYADPAFGGPSYSNRRYRYYGYMQSSSKVARPGGPNFPDDPAQNTSLLEQGIATLRGGGDWPLAPRSYVAVVERSPELTAGLATVAEESSLHVIVGHW